MRAPPPPRRSRVRFFTVYVSRIRQLCTFYKVKKRWNLHKLHVVERRGGTIVSPISAIRADDMINLPTGLQNKSNKRKPLVIASFPRGCSRSPRVKILQKNRLSRLLLSKRRYKLKYFDFTGIKEKSGSIRQEQPAYSCAYTIHSIKKATSKNADVRVIFHDSNTIKSHNLTLKMKSTKSPELLEFGPQRSIRMKDYRTLNETDKPESLKMRKKGYRTVQVSASTKSYKTELEKKGDINSAKRKCQSKSIIVLSKFRNSAIMYHSEKIDYLEYL